MPSSSCDNNVGHVNERHNKKNNPTPVTPTRMTSMHVCVTGSGVRTSRGGPRKKSDPGPGASNSWAKAVLDAPEHTSPCEVCGRVFPSWKGLFGHMRSHPERSWRGVKPPPVFTPPGSPKRGDPILGRDKEDRASRKGGAYVPGTGEGSTAAANTSSLPAKVWFDLNDEPMEAEAPSSKKQRRLGLGLGLDLNKPAPEEEDRQLHACMKSFKK